MIVFDLQCGPNGHRFEGWFGSSQDYESQQARGLVSCPSCGSPDVVKAVMAPNVGRKGNQLPVPTRGTSEPSPAPAAQPMANAPLPPEAVAMLKAVAAMQAESIKSSTWVGEKFADNARAMHYGEKDPAAIHGRATLDEARELIEEGIPVAPLLVPVVPPEETN
ncbi:DUF1178 family protein [Novosphingobium taihuense]|uniref:Uncharacterized protein n=1 Tax=Novosphingobium taihuense TaxID=260085 RepID=A0A7W7EXR5_9SPHN|nr:DUF1178 family protein [Novosphingobium taihuense]MBB4615620.1 hypothetical protein [Novosphingobium taihuense]TWH82910.1 hypothetical protein IQ25_03191 [Novosphingobium taihuense]